jgi:hypothetical protein
MHPDSFPSLGDNPKTRAAAIHYRRRAHAWRESAMAVPEGAPQQAIYREIAEGYEKLAAHYESLESLGRVADKPPESQP